MPSQPWPKSMAQSPANVMVFGSRKSWRRWVKRCLAVEEMLAVGVPRPRIMRPFAMVRNAVSAPARVSSDGAASVVTSRLPVRNSSMVTATWPMSTAAPATGAGGSVYRNTAGRGSCDAATVCATVCPLSPPLHPECREPSSASSSPTRPAAPVSIANAAASTTTPTAASARPWCVNQLSVESISGAAAATATARR